MPLSQSCVRSGWKEATVKRRCKHVRSLKQGDPSSSSFKRILRFGESFRGWAVELWFYWMLNVPPRAERDACDLGVCSLVTILGTKLQRGDGASRTTAKEDDALKFLRAIQRFTENKVHISRGLLLAADKASPTLVAVIKCATIWNVRQCFGRCILFRAKRREGTGPTRICLSFYNLMSGHTITKRTAGRWSDNSSLYATTLLLGV